MTAAKHSFTISPCLTVVIEDISDGLRPSYMVLLCGTEQDSVDLLKREFRTVDAALKAAQRELGLLGKRLVRQTTSKN